MRTLFYGISRPKVVALFISVVLLCYANGAIADVTRPVVTSVTVPDNAIYSVGESLNFTVNFNETVFVNPGGAPRLLLVIGGVLRYAEYLSGSGSTALRFRYVVLAGEQSLNGIAIVSIIILNGSIIRDAAGNDAVISLNGVGSLALVIVETTSPVVSFNTGKGVNEGQMGAVISSAQLLSTDNYSGAENVVYMVVSTTINGVLRRNGVAIAAGGTFSQSDITLGRITYDHNGSETLSDRFMFKVVDQGGNTNDNNGANFTFNFAIAAVNDIPVAGADSASTTDNTKVSIDVLANDSDADIGDSLDIASLKVVNAPSNGSATINAGKIDYTPGSGFAGTDSFTYTVNDSVGATSNAATVTVVVTSGVDSDGDTISDAQEMIDGTDPANPDDYLDITAPVVVAPADIIIDAVGLFTPVTQAQLMSVAESTPQAQLQAKIALLATDNIDGVSCCNTSVPALNDGVIILPPGRYPVTWRAVDRKGNVGTVSQMVNIRPLVSMPKAQVTVEGAVAEIRVMLNGRAPFYPFFVPYLIDTASTTNASDHDLASGVAIFSEGDTEAIVEVNIMVDGASEGDEVLIVKLDDRTSDAEDLASGFSADIYDINSGANIKHNLTIAEGNVAPTVGLVTQQGGRNTSQITRNGGLVTVLATANDLNTGDTLSLDWSASDNRLADTDGSPNNLTLIFDPSNLTLGRYTAVLTATDSAGATHSGLVHVVLVDALPTLLASADSDGDGVDDLTEGTADTDGDGIPDYLDNITATNVLPGSAGVTNAFLMECDPDVSCRLGSFSALGASGGAVLSTEDIARLNGLSEDENFELQGGIFDFEIHQLTTPGQQVSVVLPLSVAIPEEATYRKFQQGVWVSFVDDDRNDIHSSQGLMGYCPPPNDASWQQGMTAGHFCLQLTLEDGGPNDADAEVNAAISDPGAAGVLSGGSSAPASASSLSLQTSGGGGGSVGGILMAILILLGSLKRQLVLTRFTGCLTLFGGLILVFSVNNSRADAWSNIASNSFVELEVFAVNGSQESSDFSRDMLNAGVATDVTGYDVLRTGYQASLGYIFNPYATVLLSYIDLGDVHVDFDTTTTDSALLQQALNKSYPLTGDGVSVAYRYRHRFSPSVSVFADAGMFIWTGDSNTEGANVSPDIDGGTDPMIALGVDYSFLRRTSVGLKYRYHRLDSQNLNGLGMLVRVNF